MLRRSIKDILLWLVGRRLRFVIEGASMLPTLNPGDSIFIEMDYYRHHQPQKEDLVLAKHPTTHLVMVKRIAHVDQQHAFLLGDNPTHSTDSRHFGPLEHTQLMGKVWSRL